MANEIQPNATANAPAVPTQDSDLSGQQLQAPQSQPLITGQPSTPRQVPSTVTIPGRSGAIDSTKNPQLHKFVSAMVSAFAGQPTKTYQVGSDGRMNEVAQPPESTGSKLRRFVGNEMTGLAAGSEVGNRGSATANIAAGLGAGYGAVSGKMSAEDQAAKNQSKEDFEREQQAQIHQMNIGIANARNLGLYYDNVRKENDLDSGRAQNKEIAEAFKNIPGHSVTEMDAEAAAKAVADPTNSIWAHTHLILPAGMQPLTDENGNPVKDAAGDFKSKGRVYVIDGTKDGKIPLPASVASDIQKFKTYGDLAAIGEPLDHLEAGQEMEPTQFVKLYGALLSAKTEIAKGWTNPDLSEGADKNVIQHNSVDGTMTKPATEGQTQKFRMDQANLAEKQQQIKTGKSTEAKNLAEADKAKKDAAAGPSSNLTGEDYLKTLPVARQTTVRAVGEGRQTLPANRKEALAILDQVHQAYPDYDESLGKTWQKTRNEYMGAGTTAKKVVSYNTALEHMQDLYTNTTAEAIFNPVSKAHQDREVAMGYVANEVGNAIKTGVMAQAEGEKILSDLSGGITPANKRERVAETARLLHDKIEEYQNKFNEGAPSSAVKVPILISRRAAASYDFVQSDGKTQASSQTGQSQTTTPTTHIISLETAMKNHPGATEAQVRAWAKQNNYEVTN